MSTQSKANRRSAKWHPNAVTVVGTHTTNSSLAAAVTLTPPSDIINAILIQTNTQPVRYTIDGTTPTATTGFLMAVGALPQLIIISEDTQFLRVIETVASASIQYQWGRVR